MTQLAKNTDNNEITIPGVRYSYIIQNPRLRELVEQEENKQLGELDNIDSEIILVRGLIKLVAEQFSIPYIESDSGSILISSYVSTEASKIVKMANDLTSLIEKKYKILYITSENIPRSHVETYIRRIQDVLNQLLTNSCSHCGHEHNMRERVISALKLLGNI